MSVQLLKDVLGQKDEVIQISFDNKKDIAVYPAIDNTPKCDGKRDQLLFCFFENSEEDLADDKVRDVLLDGIKGKGYMPKDDEKELFDKIKYKSVLSIKFSSKNEVNQLIEMLKEIKQGFK